MSLSENTKQWLNKNCNISLKGKTVLVTGSNSGVGFKTAETAVFLGADVILACRNTNKAAAARDELLRDYPDASVRVMRLDLASLSSIDAFVAELKESKTDIYAFVNNAGAFRHPGEKTADGFDLVIGTNYIGVFYLTERLLPYLETLPHEVVYVNTVSIIVKTAKPVDYEDFFCATKPGCFAVYGRSKLCLAMYSHALACRCKGGNVRVYMNHPGVAVTPLGLNAFGKWAARLAGMLRPLINSPEKSALSLAYILSHDIPAGSLVGPHRVFDCVGYPKANRIPRKATEGAEELIRYTEQVITEAKSRRDEVE